MDADGILENLVQFSQSQRWLAREFGRITLPLLILHGTRDKVTLAAGSEAFAREAGSGDKTLKLYDGHYHDLLADLGKEAVLQDIIDWILPRIPR